MFLFLDESGDLGFDWSKKRTSPYLTITLLLCHDVPAKKAVDKAVKRTIKNKLNPSKPKRPKKELKGSNTSLPVKEYFARHLPLDGWEIYSVTLNKKRVSPELQTKAGKKRLYNFLARFLLDHVPALQTQEGHVHFVLDRSKNAEGIEDFNRYIENHLEATLPLNTKLHITHEASEQNPCLQAVDLFCWGFARKYEHNDRTWLKTYEWKVKYDCVYLPE